jgi:hypothetical protein
MRILGIVLMIFIRFFKKIFHFHNSFTFETIIVGEKFKNNSLRLLLLFAGFCLFIGQKFIFHDLNNHIASLINRFSILSIS